MFLYVAARVHHTIKSAVSANKSVVSVCRRFMAKRVTESEEQFDARYERFFNRRDIDGWQIRQGINDLCGQDMIPEPRIIAAALKACRRVNDYALAIRILEAMKEKCGSRKKDLYPWFIQEICPTLNELGIDTPEQLGYGEPEMALVSSYDM